MFRCKSIRRGGDRDGLWTSCRWQEIERWLEWVWPLPLYRSRSLPLRFFLRRPSHQKNRQNGPSSLSKWAVPRGQTARRRTAAYQAAENIESSSKPKVITNCWATATRWANRRLSYASTRSDLELPFAPNAPSLWICPATSPAAFPALVPELATLSQVREDAL